MSIEAPKPGKYELLENVLAHRNLPLQGTYSLRDAAAIFAVSVRAIQDRVRRGELVSRSLPGHARFMSCDFEDFLRRSSRRRGGRS